MSRLTIARELDPRLVGEDLANALRTALDDPLPGAMPAARALRAARRIQPSERLMRWSRTGSCHVCWRRHGRRPAARRGSGSADLSETGPSPHLRPCAQNAKRMMLTNISRSLNAARRAVAAGWSPTSERSMRWSRTGSCHVCWRRHGRRPAARRGSGSADLSGTGPSPHLRPCASRLRSFAKRAQGSVLATRSEALSHPRLALATPAHDLESAGLMRV